MRAWRLAIGTCVSLALCASLASAQAAPPARYQELVDFGLAESAAGRFAEARVAFRQAHALYPNARTLRVIGMVAFELRDYVDAVRHLEPALSEPERALDDEQRFQVSGLLDQARGLIARFTTEALPRDATLFVDGRPAVIEPSGVLLLAIGDHRLVVRKGQQVLADSPVTVRGGEHAPLPVLLEPAGSTTPAPAPAPEAREPAPELEPEPEPLFADPPARQGEGFPTGPVIVISAGAVLAIVGGVLLASGLGDVADVEDAPIGTEWSKLQPAYDRAPMMTGLGIGLLALGGVSLVSGSVWLALEGDESSPVSGVRAGLRGAF